MAFRFTLGASLGGMKCCSASHDLSITRVPAKELKVPTGVIGEVKPSADRVTGFVGRPSSSATDSQALFPSRRMTAAFLALTTLFSGAGKTT